MRVNLRLVEVNWGPVDWEADAYGQAVGSSWPYQATFYLRREFLTGRIHYSIPRMRTKLVIRTFPGFSYVVGFRNVELDHFPKVRESASVATNPTMDTPPMRISPIPARWLSTPVCSMPQTTRANGS